MSPSLPPEYEDAIRRIATLASAHARDSERDRTLHPSVVQALRQSGLLSLAAPREVGGKDADVETQFLVYEAAARADGSTGWCLMIGSLTTAMMGALLPARAVERIFGAEMPIAAGLQQPLGVARRRAGGWVVDGRWGFASGIAHADWILTPTVVEGAALGPLGIPTMLLVAVPAKDVTIDRTWDAAGLRGTGSHHYRVDGVCVEEAFTCPFPNGPALRGGPLHKLPFLAYVAVGHIGFALGVAQRALDEIVSIAPSKIRTWTRQPLSDDVPFRVGLGRAFAKLASARAWAREVLAAIQARVAAGQDLTPHDWASVRAVTAHATDMAADVAAFAYRAGGASALDGASLLQRCLRDTWAATQHVAADDEAYRLASDVLLSTPLGHPLLAPRR